MRHVTIYREPGRYAGWPANYGMWNWEHEIVLGFTVGYHHSQGEFHARDKSRPFMNVQARSLDAGETWTIETFPGKTPGSRGLSADEHMNEGLGVGAVLDAEPPAVPAEKIDFTHPDFALMCARTGLKRGTRSFFYVSYNRCRSWQGPYMLPMLGQTGVQARTNYIVMGQHECLMFLTANKDSGREGHVICVHTLNGGKSFSLLSSVSGEPEGDGFAIMPASLRLDSIHFLCALRCRGGNRATRQDHNWIDLYRSDDTAATWRYVNRPVVFNEQGHNGNPPTLHRLVDGRLVMTYGNRDAPYTIEARISEDEGYSWSEAIVLRDGGGNYDIGYPRTVVLPDGKVVTAYYFNDQPDGDRYIAATIWQP